MQRPRFRPRGLATAIGSMPHTDPDEACRVVLRFLPEIPAWPQLPNRSFVENMYFQFRPSFLPGLTQEVDGRFHIDLSENFSEGLERLYADYLKNDCDRYEIKADRRAGLDAFLKAFPAGELGKRLAIKGQVTGPVSWGLTVADERSQRPLIYDEIVADAIAKSLKLQAAWQERVLGKLCSNTIIFVDEPYMASFGSAFVSLSREKVAALFEEVFGGLTGLKGVHCCGNTDWSVLLDSSVDILSVDAYNYGETLGLYPAEVRRFLARGGVIAWGIVPSDEEALVRQGVDSLLERLEALFGYLKGKGIPQEELLQQCLITPSCGLGSLSLAGAVRALELVEGVSAKFRKLYHGVEVDAIRRC